MALTADQLGRAAFCGSEDQGVDWAGSLRTPTGALEMSGWAVVGVALGFVGGAVFALRILLGVIAASKNLRPLAKFAEGLGTWRVATITGGSGATAALSHVLGSQEVLPSYAGSFAITFGLLLSPLLWESIRLSAVAVRKAAEDPDD